MTEEQAKKKKDESKDVKEELTEDELKCLPGGVGVENTGQKNTHVGAYGGYDSPQNHDTRSIQSLP